MSDQQKVYAAILGGLIAGASSFAGLIWFFQTAAAHNWF